MGSFDLVERDCILIEHHNTIIGLNFMITSTKLNVPVVTLSINNIFFFRKLEARIQETISWNKYRSEIKTQQKKKTKTKTLYD